jgi:hypothetical protein
LQPGFFESNFNRAVVFAETYREITEVLGVDVRFQIDLGFADRESGFAAADFARRLEAGYLLPASDPPTRTAPIAGLKVFGADDPEDRSIAVCSATSMASSASRCALLD